MAKRRSVSVSWHEASQFVKWVGKTRSKDGSLKPKCVYQGEDETSSISRAGSLRNEWTTLKSQGIDAWPDQTDEQQDLPQQAIRPLRVTVDEASKEFLLLIKAEADARQITRQHYKATRYPRGASRQLSRDAPAGQTLTPSAHTLNVSFARF
jgi:hypothetical protein